MKLGLDITHFGLYFACGAIAPIRDLIQPAHAASMRSPTRRFLMPSNPQDLVPTTICENCSAIGWAGASISHLSTCSQVVETYTTPIFQLMTRDKDALLRKLDMQSLMILVRQGFMLDAEGYICYQSLVDRACQKLTGLGVDELCGDWESRGGWDTRVDPDEMAACIAEESGFSAYMEGE